MLWLGSYSESPINPSTGYCYYNIEDCCSYIWNGISWEILAKDGISGTNGKSIIWKGALSAAPENPEENWTYYNTSTQISYIWSGASWDILAQSIGGDTTVQVAINWRGSFTSAPTNPKVGDAYYNSTLKASYIYDGTVWQQISKDGQDGTYTYSGTGYLITWKGSLTSAPSNPKAGWAYYNSKNKTSYVYDGSSWQIMAKDGSDENDADSGNSPIVYIGDTTETIDGITYVVKSYADVFAAEPYFYTYYKYYYLNNKLRRTYSFNHTYGSVNLDHKYSEFIEHTCGTNTGMVNESGYSESGILEFHIQRYSSNGIYTKLISFFDELGTKIRYENYQDDKIYYIYTYYNNGKTKENMVYNLESGYMAYYYSYYENGKYDEKVYFDNQTGKKTQHIKYNDAGQEKICLSYQNGILYRVETYYESGKDELDCVKYDISTGNIELITYYYETGYVKYYYKDGYLYTYTDGKTTSTSTSSTYYSSKVAKTQDEIKEFAETLYDTSYNTSLSY